jgi:DNA-binding CsgD family transcriptional regulator
MIRADLDMRRGRLAAAAAFWDANRNQILSMASLDSRLEAALRDVDLMLWRGEPAAALREASTILKQLYATDYSRFAGGLFVLALRACADAAERGRAAADTAAVTAALQSGDHVTALLAAANLDPFEAKVPATAHADALCWQAEASRLRGESDSTLWHQAAMAWDAISRRHRAAYAQWRQAEALLAHRGGRHAASLVLRAAAAQAAQHAPLSAAIRDLARRARIGPSEPGHIVQPEEAPAVSQFGLTDRELAVLQLLSEGKTNSEIGAALYISRKTASVHVTNILRKLQVTSRVQAATVAERAGLLTNVADPAGS